MCLTFLIGFLLKFCQITISKILLLELTLPLEVTGSNREVLSGTDGVEISCTITGLALPVKSVTWKKDDIDVTSLTGYDVDQGTLVADTQTTTLTVAKDQINVDSAYKCLFQLITDQFHHAIVSLNIFSK